MFGGRARLPARVHARACVLFDSSVCWELGSPIGSEFPQTTANSIAKGEERAQSIWGIYSLEGRARAHLKQARVFLFS